jgi:NADH-quinone oxidoreductase subunit G
MEIEVDGRVIAADPAQNLLQAALSAGADVPYFCWHPAMGSVGSCRQCAVKVFSGPGDVLGQVVMACMTAVIPGMRVSIADETAAKFREKMVEVVLTNHPHDCPVCEVGGECHLQDMTVLTGHAARRSTAPKRTHRNQDLGPFIRHEMNRCIGCYRCVRFYRDYAGGEDFGVFGAAKNVFFGRAEDGALENPFAGNLVEVCPTGVFVDKPFSQNFRRKWDMRATPSVCPHCAVGCNVTVNERGGKFRRVVNRYNETLNGYFLCDRGRFGAGFLAGPGRLTRGAPPAALREFCAGGEVIGIGSPRASMEANFLLRRLVGPKNFYAGLSAHDAGFLQAAMAIMRRVPVATLRDAELADAVLIFGDDPALAAPRLALALRQAGTRAPAAILAERQIPVWHDSAARLAGAGHKIPFIVATPAVTALDGVASAVIRDSPDGLVARAGALAAALSGAKNPVIVAGGSVALIMAAANIAIETGGKILILLPEANSAGLGLLDARPLAAAVAAARGRRVLILESDVFAREAEAADQIFDSAKTVCVLDHVATATVARASLAVAVAAFAESDGHFVNFEGRVQKFHKAIFGEDDPPESWRLLRDLAAPEWRSHADVLAALGREVPEFAGLRAPAAGDAPTLPHRYSGRNAARADVDVREAAPPMHLDSPFGTTMEGVGDSAVLWEPGWNSNQAVNKQVTVAVDFFVPRGQMQGGEGFALPEKPWSYLAADGTEELSALSPAIIARGAV